MSSNRLAVALALAVAGSQMALAQRDGAMRFQEMDRNKDGRISRTEWQGSAQEFNANDWNRDGVLSGDELRVGGGRAGAQRNPPDPAGGRDYEFDDWTARGFANIDDNHDNRISADEWHFDQASFRRADHNGDGVVSRSEFLNEDAAQEGGTEDRFTYLDLNRDNHVSRDEWHGAPANFDRLDANRDGLLTRAEVGGRDVSQNVFASADVNRDGTIARDEWHGSRASFDRLDRNRDGRLTRKEFSSNAAASAQSEAYKAGYTRGLVEGRAAGREDKERNQGWDLEGQRELEQADSGYNATVGSREDYQAGYRAAFRMGYPEGYGPR